jgi:ketosteroid isomerase-like protein
MSQENVEIVRRLFEEFQIGLKGDDPGAFLDSEAVADDYEWVIPPPGLDGRSVWRGREGFVEFMATWTEQFEDWTVQIERLIDAGENRVVAVTHQSGTGKGSGVPVEMSISQVLELEGGRLARVTNYLSHAEALEAAGLSE